MELPTNGRYVRHIFLCVEEVKPKCARPEQTKASWAYLKRRIVELGLAVGHGCIYRSKVSCLRICEQGPIALVYPDGCWYRHAVPEVIERILQEHIIGGQPVEEFIFARNPLTL